MIKSPKLIAHSGPRPQKTPCELCAFAHLQETGRVRRDSSKCAKAQSSQWIFSRLSNCDESPQAETILILSAS